MPQVNRSTSASVIGTPGVARPIVVQRPGNPGAHLPAELGEERVILDCGGIGRLDVVPELFERLRRRVDGFHAVSVHRRPGVGVHETDPQRLLGVTTGSLGEAAERPVHGGGVAGHRRRDGVQDRR
jgi:hypothetical protein